MMINSDNTDSKWRLQGGRPHRHRFSPLIPADSAEGEQKSQWQDYQQAFDTGYKEGISKGHEDGFNSGSEEGLRSGHASGFNQGCIEGQLKGKEAIDDQLNQLIVPIDALKSLLEEGHNQQILQQQATILELIRRVSQQVIRCELTLQPQQILSLIEETMEALPDTTSEMKIHLEPNAVDKLKELASEKIKHWTLVADPSISPGGCRIISDKSDADASVETRLNACMDQVAIKLDQHREKALSQETESSVDVK